MPAQALAIDEIWDTEAPFQISGVVEMLAELINANIQIIDTINGHVGSFGLALVLYTLIVKSVTLGPNLLL